MTRVSPTSVVPVVVPVAQILYRLVSGRAPEPEELEQAADFFAATGAPVDRRSFRRLTASLLHSLPQQRDLLELLPRWGEVFASENIAVHEAEEFIRQYIGAMDHSLFVKLPLFVGRYAGESDQLVSFGQFGHTQVDSWMLVYTQDGCSGFRAGVRDYSLRPGVIALIAPGTVTEFRDPAEGAWCFSWLIFQASDNWRSLLQWPAAGPGVSLLELGTAQRRSVQLNLELLYDNFVSSGPVKTQLDHNLLEQLLLRCAGHQQGQQTRVLDPRIQSARAYIEEHFATDITLADIAAASRLSPSRLSSLYKTETGTSAMAYRTELRLVQAAQLLLHSKLRIAEVAFRVGYTEQAFFSRIFRRYLGMSPREYRSNMSVPGTYQLRTRETFFIAKES